MLEAMQPLDWMERELSLRAKLRIYQVTEVLSIARGHELWVTIKRITSGIQTARVSGLTLTGSVRGLDIQKERQDAQAH